jgi:hypothetical protein
MKVKQEITDIITQGEGMGEPSLRNSPGMFGTPSFNLPVYRVRNGESIS